MSEKIDKKVIKLIIRLVIVIVVAAAVIFVVHAITKDEPAEITNTFISDKLEAASELTSAKMTYNGLIRYEDGDIPYITQKAFTMVYRAEVKAGIDLSKVKVNVTDSKVEIDVPKIEVLDITIDHDSIEYYDEKSALFNWESKEDVTEAVRAAKEDVTANGGLEDLEATAKEQIGVLLNGLFKDSIGDRKLVINYQK